MSQALVYGYFGCRANESITLLIFLSTRFFLGSNKVMQVALGRSVSDEIRPGLHKVSKVCLLFIVNLLSLSSAFLDFVFLSAKHFAYFPVSKG